MKNYRSELRLGVVPYLNVLPLVEGLDDTFPRKNWVHATPRELSGLLAAGEIDVATLPVYDALRAGVYPMFPGCAIGCDGPVRSVRLCSVKPFDAVRHVLLDRSSLTSVHLAQILAIDLLDIHPMYELSEQPIAADFNLESSGFDAVVVIGDVALDWERRFPYTLDLGAAWKELTGMPFVFAGWFSRPNLKLAVPEFRAFVQARNRGERSTYEIAKRAAGQDTKRLLDLVSYLSRSIHYRLGEPEIAAIEEFRRRLVMHGLLSGEAPKMRLLSDPEATNSARPLRV